MDRQHHTFDVWRHGMGECPRTLSPVPHTPGMLVQLKKGRVCVPRMHWIAPPLACFDDVSCGNFSNARPTDVKLFDRGRKPWEAGLRNVGTEILYNSKYGEGEFKLPRQAVCKNHDAKPWNRQRYERKDTNENEKKWAHLVGLQRNEAITRTGSLWWCGHNVAYRCTNICHGRPNSVVVTKSNVCSKGEAGGGPQGWVHHGVIFVQHGSSTVDKI